MSEPAKTIPAPSVTIEEDNSLPQACLDSGNATFYRLYASFDPETRHVSFHEDHPSVNSTPMNVWHGLVDTYKAPRGADAEQVRDVLLEHLDRFARLADGYEKEWDGHNHVGRWNSENADEDRQAIADAVEQIEPAWTCSSFSEWLWPAKAQILAEMKQDGETPESMANKLEDEARVENNLLLVGNGAALLRSWQAEE